MLVDDARTVQRMQIDLGPQGPDGSLALRNNTRRLAEYGFASNPPPGTDVVMLFPGGDHSNGVVIATGNQIFRLRGLPVGDVAIHDNRGHIVWLKADGIWITGDVHVDGSLSVTGDVTDRCEAQSATLADLRQAYLDHKHDGVAAGGAKTGLTDHEL